MGGRIIVESKLGVGSTFVVRLPMSMETRPRFEATAGIESAAGDEHHIGLAN
jgi:chemotaxis protein histidine kinase CheA